MEQTKIANRDLQSLYQGIHHLLRWRGNTNLPSIPGNLGKELQGWFDQIKPSGCNENFQEGMKCVYQIVNQFVATTVSRHHVHMIESSIDSLLFWEFNDWFMFREMVQQVAAKMRNKLGKRHLPEAQYLYFDICRQIFMAYMNANENFNGNTVIARMFPQAYVPTKPLEQFTPIQQQSQNSRQTHAPIQQRRPQNTQGPVHHTTQQRGPHVTQRPIHNHTQRQQQQQRPQRQQQTRPPPAKHNRNNNQSVRNTQTQQQTPRLVAFLSQKSQTLGKITEKPTQDLYDRSQDKHYVKANAKDEQDRFLSNFKEENIVVMGMTFTSPEQCYQFTKALAAGDCYSQGLIMHTNNPYELKKIGNRIHKSNNWENIKKDVMRNIIGIRIQQSETFTQLLAATNRGEIRHPTGGYWGTPGQNWFGRILMEWRTILQEVDTTTNTTQEYQEPAPREQRPKKTKQTKGLRFVNDTNKQMNKQTTQQETQDTETEQGEHQYTLTHTHNNQPTQNETTDPNPTPTQNPNEQQTNELPQQQDNTQGTGPTDEENITQGSQGPQEQATQEDTGESNFQVPLSKSNPNINHNTSYNLRSNKDTNDKAYKGPFLSKSKWENRKVWQLHNTKAKTIIIGDSNIKHITNTGAINSIDLYSFGGAAFGDVLTLLEKSQKKNQIFPHVKNVILSIGINHRNDNDDTTSRNIIMTQICTTLENLQIVFPDAILSIPIINYSNDLTSVQKSNMEQLNDIIHKVATYYTNLVILPPINEGNFTTHTDNIHWTNTTANNILQNWHKHLNFQQ